MPTERDIQDPPLPTPGGAGSGGRLHISEYGGLSGTVLVGGGFDHLRPEPGVDMVNHPPHYKHPSGVETILASEHANFCLGNAIKYVLRAPNKGTELLDLEKAEFYLKRLIGLLQAQPATLVWLSPDGKAVALETLITIRNWEEDRWFDNHPRPMFYTEVIHDDWEGALVQVRNLIKLAKG